ncbi:MAG: cysteine hydrolase [Acidobacteria bacterium]|nr:cysteine hydrolase [Acidobacteriota bacterium]
MQPGSVAHPDGSPSLDSPAADDTWWPDPATTAALVVDVQRLFTDMVGAPIQPPLSDVLPRIGRFVDDSRRARATIVLVRTIIAPDAHSRSTLQWPEFMRAGMAPGAPGTKFDPCLNPQPGDIEVVKQRYSAFVGTRLDEILRDRSILSVIVLGLTTNVCVQSTARDAWQRDYQTITLADCCAEIGEGSHDASLAWTGRNFGTVCKSDEVSRRWRRRPSDRVSGA